MLSTENGAKRRSWFSRRMYGEVVRKLNAVASEEGHLAQAGHGWRRWGVYCGAVWAEYRDE